MNLYVLMAEFNTIFAVKNASAEDYQKLKSLILQSQLSDSAFEFDDEKKQIKSTYSYTEWIAFQKFPNELGIGSELSQLVEGTHKTGTKPFEVQNTKAQGQMALQYQLKIRKDLQKVEQPEKPTIPAATGPSMSMLDLIAQSYQSSNGLIFGDNFHDERAPKDFICEQMATLKNSGVKYFFLEHFMESQQPMLDHFFETGEMPKELDVYLKYLSDGTDNHKEVYPGFRSLLQGARDNGIKPVACETSVSYSITQNIGATAKRRDAGTHVMYNKIKDTVAEDDKWVAFIGTTHLGSKESFGLDKLLGVPAVGLQGSEPNQKQHLCFGEEVDGGGGSVKLDINIHIDPSSKSKNMLIKDEKTALDQLQKRDSRPAAVTMSRKNAVGNLKQFSKPAGISRNKENPDEAEKEKTKTQKTPRKP